MPYVLCPVMKSTDVKVYFAHYTEAQKWYSEITLTRMCAHKRFQGKTTFVGLTHFWFQMSPNIQESLDFQLFFGGKYAGQRTFTRNNNSFKSGL